MNRDCKNCVYHSSGSCSKWNCEFTTVDDVRNKAIDNFVKAIDEADREDCLVDDMLRIEQIAEQLKAGGNA